jgi:hemoglobin/transferrin/lactoferrin receptor protein
MATVFANVNRDKAYVAGGSFYFKGALSERWSTRGGITYTEGKTYDTNEYMSSIPPVFGNLGLTYSIKKFDFDVAYEFNAAKAPGKYNIFEGIDNIEQTPVVDENAPSEVDRYAGTPSWEVVDFSVFYNLNNNLELQFKTTNIFDIHYKDFASGISAPGRNFSASARYLF